MPEMQPEQVIHFYTKEALEEQDELAKQVHKQKMELARNRMIFSPNNNAYKLAYVKLANQAEGYES